MNNLFFIFFSAGLGSRLNAPFPKPLSPILNTTLLDNNLNNAINLILNLNIRSFLIYVNLHKEAYKIYEHTYKKYYWLVKREKIKFLFEHKLLGHIGTINKLKYNILRYKKLILINSDIFIPNLEIYLSKAIQLHTNTIFLYKTRKDKISQKTITHFEVKKYQELYKIKSFTKEMKDEQEYVNLYTGVAILNINKFFQNLVLDSKFSTLTFLDFLDILIKEELLAIFVDKFFEVTSTKDLLELNVALLETKPFLLNFS